MKKIELLNMLNDIAPFDTQYEWDNCGIQIDLGKTDIEKILVAMEISNAVIDEAIENKVSLILTHHPLLFNPVKKLSSADCIQNYIIRLIQAGIEVISMHTCYDKARGGMNDALLSLLPVEKIDLLGDGCARIATLKNPEPLEKIVYELDDKLNHPGIRFNGDLEMPVQTIACCTGSGSEYIKDALEEGADLFISGEIKHNYGMLGREANMAVIEAGHWGTEQIFTDNIIRQIKNKDESLELIKSSVDLNPFSSII